MIKRVQLPKEERKTNYEIIIDRYVNPPDLLPEN